MWKSVLTILVFTSFLGAAELSEKFAKKLSTAEETYKSAVQKADNARFYAVQKANQDRTKLLKALLADATKAGDFDAATEIKARLAGTGLGDSITDGEWQAPTDRWGRFVFRPDGTALIESWKGNIRWMAIDETTVVIVGKDDKPLWADALHFDKDRTKLTVHSIGSEGGPSWDAKKIPRGK